MDSRKPIGLLLTLLGGVAALQVQAQPQGAQVVHGSALFESGPGRLTITNSPNAIINWRGFSIGRDEITRFIQQGSASAVLNRVTGGDPSRILGQLLSNGRVYLINPNGIVFGRDSIIDTAGLIASTLGLSDSDFLAGRLNFEGNARSGAIENHGLIRTGRDGNILLIAPDIENGGIIESDGGRLILAAGQKIEITSLDDPHIRFEVQAPEHRAVNLGEMIANGGSVDLLAGSIVNQGIISADAVEVDAAGNIRLVASGDVGLTAGSRLSAGGGAIRIESGSGEILQQGEVSAGRVDMTGTMVNNVGSVRAGAAIRIEGDNVVQQGTLEAPGGEIRIDAGDLYHEGVTRTDNPGGSGGEIRITTSGRHDATGGSRISATGETGGRIALDGGAGQIATSATLDAGGSRSGGTVEVTAGRVALLNADLKADGGQDGGTVHVGGEWQGGGDLPQAAETIVGVGSELSATGETGGEIVVWSTESTGFYGAADASGSREGGRIELSSRLALDWQGPDFAPVTPGAGGMLLLDPKDIIVTNTPPSEIAWVFKLTDGSSLGGGSQTLTLGNGDWFGAATSLDGDRLAVGALADDTGGSDRGAVYLFNGVGTDYSGLTLQAKLAHGSLGGTLVLQDGDVFGSAVALDGDRLAVGALNDDTGGTDRGAVYLFNGVGADYSGLVLQQKLADGSLGGAVTLADGDSFGVSVALDGDHLAVGSWADDTGGLDRGSVHLFSGVGSDYSGLTLETRLADGSLGGTLQLADSDYFGYSVALNGDLLAVGAYGDDTGGGERGAVYLFNGVGADYSGLALQVKLADGSLGGAVALGDFDIFGASVALDGDLLAVGAPLDDGFGFDRGALYLFRGTGTDYSGLGLQQTLEDGGIVLLNDGASFGSSVAIDGDRMAVGALGDGPGGAVYLFNGLVSGAGGDVANARFDYEPSLTLHITPQSITDILDTGAGVSLQANNDITIDSPIVVNAGGAGGELKLEAGRHIYINADIVTDNGTFHAEANTTIAHGTQSDYRDAGSAGITMADGVVIDVGSGTLDLMELDGDGLANDTSGDILVEQLTGHQVMIDLVGTMADGGSILRVSADSLISATTLSMSNDGFNNGGIGTAGDPLPLAVDRVEAYIAEATDQGIFLDSAADLTIGLAHNEDRGLQAHGGGEIVVTASGQRITVDDTLFVGGDHFIKLDADTIRFTGGTRLEIGGTGAIDLVAGLVELAGDQVFGDPTTMTTLDLGGHTIQVDAPVVVSDLTVAGSTDRITGSDVLTVGRLDIKDSGTLTLDGGALAIGTGATVAGTLNIANAVLMGEVLLDVTGILNLNGLAALILDVANLGSVIVQAGDNSIGGLFTNQGTLDVRAGTLQLTQDYTQSGALARTLLSGGELLAMSGPSQFGSDAQQPEALSPVEIRIDGGSLSGYGSLAGNVTMGPGTTLAAGASPGTLEIIGDLILDPGSVVETEIGGTMPGSQYDVIVVQGAATLAGTLDVTHVNGYQPGEGASFVPISFSDGSGGTRFDTVNVPSGYSYDAVYNANDVTMNVTGVPEPVDPGPVDPGPIGPGPVDPDPGDTPDPDTPDPDTPDPDTPDPDTPDPDTPDPDTPDPDTPDPDTPDPDTPDPDTPNPDTPGPDTPGTGTPGSGTSGQTGNQFAQGGTGGLQTSSPLLPQSTGTPNQQQGEILQELLDDTANGTPVGGESLQPPDGEGNSGQQVMDCG